MDAKNGIRQRRQERIRRIMEQQLERREDTFDTVNSGTTAPLGLPPQERQLPANTAGAGFDEKKLRPLIDKGHRRHEHQDPERLWKTRPHPWEQAGWRMAGQSHAESDERMHVSGRAPGFIVKGLFVQTVIAAALYAIVFALFHWDAPLAKKGQAAVTAALTEQMNFDTVSAYYNKLFAGAPSFIPGFGADKGEAGTRLAEGEVALPIVSPLVNGAVVRSFAETLGGVEIAGKPGDRIVAAETGRVLLVTEDSKTGKTVVIQHADDRVTVYGKLTAVTVAANDWVDAGEPIGKLGEATDGQTSLLFFAVKEKGRYVDPADVVPFD